MDVMQAIRMRRSVRAYADKPINAELMQYLKDALRLAPSACNLQPWKFVLITQADLRQKVATACMGQMWMAEAPLIVAACGMTSSGYKKMGGHNKNSVDIDVTIALDHLSLAAAAQGLGTCWIGAFDEGAVKALLKVPDDVTVVALMPVGWPAKEGLLHDVGAERRKSEDDVFGTEQYSVG